MCRATDFLKNHMTDVISLLADMTVIIGLKKVTIVSFCVNSIRSP